MISTHYYNCTGILVRINLKMATWVVETCLWLLCNKIIFINPREFVGSLKNFKHLINAQNMEHSTTTFRRQVLNMTGTDVLFSTSCLGKVRYFSRNAIQSLRSQKNKTDNQRRVKQKQQVKPLCPYVSHKKTLNEFRSNVGLVLVSALLCRVVLNVIPCISDRLYTHVFCRITLQINFHSHPRFDITASLSRSHVSCQ